jgi:hypothetical protein
MNDTPPTDDDAADDLEALYRRSSAQDPSRPSAKTRRAILEHSLRIATDRTQTPRSGWRMQSKSSPAVGQIARIIGLLRPKWQRPVLVGTLTAAALAGLLIGPRYLRPVAPPVTLQMSAKSAISELQPPAPSRPSGRAVAATSESAPTVMNLPATAPAPRFQAPARVAAPRADAAESAMTERAASAASSPGAMAGLAAAAADAGEEVTVTGMRIRRIPDGASRIDAKDNNGRTALMLAVLQDRSDAVMELLRRGADPNVADNSGVTPLQVARAKNRPQIVDALVQAGAR